MPDLAALHSCLFLEAENERITAKYKRLKSRYNTLLAENGCNYLKSTVEREQLGNGTTDVATQTCVPQAANEQEKHSVKLLQTHAALVRKYEKELSINTENSETIANLKVSNSKLEIQLKAAREKVQKSTIALESYKSATEKKLIKNKEDIFQCTAERDSLRYKYEKLKSEMRGIDKNFFDEIEDLKYALQESAKLNKIYEKTLQTVCLKNKIDVDKVLLATVSKYDKHR